MIPRSSPHTPVLGGAERGRDTPRPSPSADPCAGYDATYAEAYSAAEIAAEAACPEDRVHWLAAIGLIRPDQQGRFTYGDSLALKMVSALLESGLPAETIERTAAEGLL